MRKNLNKIYLCILIFYLNKLLSGDAGIKLFKHWLPLYWGGQIQWKLLPLVWHWPPFWHGFGLQGSYFILINEIFNLIDQLKFFILNGATVDTWLQFCPVSNGGQVQLYEFPAGLHWPLLLQGFGEHGFIGWLIS